jgi:3-deoxy-D-arabino-heptulosonate 7-phosphate (DAHP) synthase
MLNASPILLEAQILAHKVSTDPEGFLGYMGGLEIENQRLTQMTEELTKRNDELRSIIDRAHENFVRGFEAQPVQARELENHVRALETEVRQLRRERVVYKQ